jgi:glycosyltransferase involved in cell wall biosynthesis
VRPGMSSKGKMKRVLMVLFYFPPDGHMGTKRGLGFVKYLKYFGWEPIVLTVEPSPSCYPWYDNDLMSKVPPEVKVFRTKVFNNLMFNDVGARWIPYLIPEAARILGQIGFDVIFITGGPYLHFLLGYIIKAKYGIPYVLDYRDGWCVPYVPEWHTTLKSKVSKTIAQTIQPLYLSGASRAIFVTDTMKESYLETFNLPSSKCVTITNGFDPDDFEGLEPKSFDKFTIAYVGRIYGGEDPIPFLRAFREVVGGARIKAGIQFIHVGPHSVTLSGLDLDKMVEQLRLTEYVKRVGLVPHAQALRYIVGADIVLLLGGTKVALTGKIFEYLASSKPILALAPSDGEIDRLIRRFSHCFFIENTLSNVDKIRSTIEHVYSSRDSLPQPEEGLIDKFSRVNLTKQLAEVLEKAIAGR